MLHGGEAIIGIIGQDGGVVCLITIKTTQDKANKFGGMGSIALHAVYFPEMKSVEALAGCTDGYLHKTSCHFECAYFYCSKKFNAFIFWCLSILIECNGIIN